MRTQPQADYLPHASSLHGLCREKRPIGIDLPGLLLHLLRQERPWPEPPLLPDLAAKVLNSRALFNAASHAAQPALALLNQAPRASLPPGHWRGWRQGRSLPQAPGSTLLGGKRRPGH